MRRISAIFGWVVLLSSTHSLATQYASTVGSNQHPYKTWEKAARSIQDAIDASTGGPVFVAAGEYVGNVTVPPNLSVYGAGAASCIIRGVPPGQHYWSSVVFMDAETRLSGFTVDAEGCYDGIICHGGEVTDCVVLRARSRGISARYAFIHGCAVQDNVFGGIAASGVTVVYDTVVSGSWTGACGIGQEYVLFVHCTISGNRTGLNNVDGRPISVRDSIVWGNSRRDIYADFTVADVVGCDTSEARFLGVNGNISADPLFLGWGEFNDWDNPIYVDCSNTGQQEGTKERAFRTIGAALRAYDFRLAVDSPCIGAASDGLNMGAFPEDVPTRERSPSVLINVAPGTYTEGDLMIQDGVHLRASPLGGATIVSPRSHTIAWLDGASWIEGFSLGANRHCGIECTAGSTPLISRCRLFPHALDEESAIRALADARPTISGCIIHGFEVAVARGALIEGCTLVNNEIAILGPDTGAPPEIRNSIMWSSAPNGASALVNVPPSNISHCLVSDRCLDGVNANIFADPQFINGENGDFRLLPTSPCIDAGDNASPYLPERDIAGRHRIMYGGKSLTVDMGAYEYYINEVQPGPGRNQTTLTWSSLWDSIYRVFYSDDLLTWHVAQRWLASDGNKTTSWIDDGSKTGIPPSLAPRRFYRILENP